MDALRRPIVVKGRSKRDVASPEIYSASSARYLRGGQPHQRPLKQKGKKDPSWALGRIPYLIMAERASAEQDHLSPWKLIKNKMQEIDI